MVTEVGCERTVACIVYRPKQQGKPGFVLGVSCKKSGSQGGIEAVEKRILSLSRDIEQANGLSILHLVL